MGFIIGVMIYIVHTNCQSKIKIGYTAASSVFDRIAQLQTGNPEKIEPLFTAEGSLQEEKALHAAMGKLLEWAHLPPAINEWYPGRHPVVKNVIACFAAHGPVEAVAQIISLIDSKPRIPVEAYEAYGQMKIRLHRKKKLEAERARAKNQINPNFIDQHTRSVKANDVQVTVRKKRVIEMDIT